MSSLTEICAQCGLYALMIYQKIYLKRIPEEKKSTVNRGRLELVWDIDHKTFKYFNHETKVGELTIRTVDTYMEYFEK